jgi:hypothetical protein
MHRSACKEAHMHRSNITTQGTAASTGYAKQICLLEQHMNRMLSPEQADWNIR